MTYREFLDWLSREDFNPVGAVNGMLIYVATSKGHAEIDGDTCFVTEAGWDYLAQKAE